MTIRIGDRLPEASFFAATADGAREVTSSDIFKNRKVVLFAVPGAFTPTCHEMHLPGFLSISTPSGARASIRLHVLP